MKLLTKQAQKDATRLYHGKYHGQGRCNKNQRKRNGGREKQLTPWSNSLLFPRFPCFLRGYSDSRAIWALEDLIQTIKERFCSSLGYLSILIITESFKKTPLDRHLRDREKKKKQQQEAANAWRQIERPSSCICISFLLFLLSFNSFLLILILTIFFWFISSMRE